MQRLFLIVLAALLAAAILMSVRIMHAQSPARVMKNTAVQFVTGHNGKDDTDVLHRPQGDDHWVVKDARLTVNYRTHPAERWHWGALVLETKKAAPFSVEFTLSNVHLLR
jgi:hypothetical protein